MCRLSDVKHFHRIPTGESVCRAVQGTVQNEERHFWSTTFYDDFDFFFNAIRKNHCKNHHKFTTSQLWKFFFRSELELLHLFLEYPHIEFQRNIPRPPCFSFHQKLLLCIVQAGHQDERLKTLALEAKLDGFVIVKDTSFTLLAKQHVESTVDSRNPCTSWIWQFLPFFTGIFFTFQVVIAGCLNHRPYEVLILIGHSTIEDLHIP